MKYFNKYKSNTLASSQNQSYFLSDNSNQKGRIFYRVFSGGEYEYSFMFSNSVDSTYADGAHSRVNLKCKDWKINYANVYIVNKDENDLSNPKIKYETILTFSASTEKTVISGEIFYSDPLMLKCEKDDYICLEIGFKGEQIPYFEEMIIPSYRYIDGKWILSKETPISCMVGCNRQVEKKVGFLGDSITEGIGVDMNSYEHWNAKIAEFVGEKYSYWNLGIGFARASDAASNGAWLNKAKEMDVVTVCLGVNDLGRGYSATEIKCNLKSIVKILQDNNVKTILFTIPPFGYQEENLLIWKEVNSYILNEMSKITKVYDVVPIWGDKAPNEQYPIYGGHPNAEGCLKLAKDFAQKIEL